LEVNPLTSARPASCSTGWFVGSPGLKVVLPVNPADARGLRQSAIRHEDPLFALVLSMYRAAPAILG
jgi:pyruvate/2-oxoglutarate/acetoin dehydrogenase E1 component